MNESRNDILARATLARYVAELFAEPDEDWRVRLNDESTYQQVRQSASTLEFPSSMVDPLTVNLPLLDELSEVRSRIFGHAVRSECPPYEMEYQKGEVFQQANALSDIVAFYRAFGLEAAGGSIERADHISAEWEFLSVASWKHASALVGNAEAADTCRSAQRTFLKDHAAVWMPAFFHRVRQTRPRGMYHHAAALGELLLINWCEAFDVPTGENLLQLRPAADEDLGIQCGDAAGPGAVELGPRLAAALSERS